MNQVITRAKRLGMLRGIRSHEFKDTLLAWHENKAPLDFNELCSCEGIKFVRQINDLVAHHTSRMKPKEQQMMKLKATLYRQGTAIYTTHARRTKNVAGLLYHQMKTKWSDLGAGDTIVITDE